TPMTSSPLAKGSRVPACPHRAPPSARRTASTTSWLVGPSGLSTRSRPSVSFRLITARVVVRAVLIVPMHLGEEPLDPTRAPDRLVLEEGEGGSEAQAQVTTEVAPESPGRAGEGLHRGLPLDEVRLVDGHVDPRRLEVARDRDRRHGRETQAGIAQLGDQARGEVALDLLGGATRSLSAAQPRNSRPDSITSPGTLRSASSRIWSNMRSRGSRRAATPRKAISESWSRS